MRREGCAKHSASNARNRGYLPIGLLRGHDPAFALGAAGMALLLTMAGFLLFRAGLRRYTSGNAMAMRN